jgi:hypothetical protein
MIAYLPVLTDAIMANGKVKTIKHRLWGSLVLDMGRKEAFLSGWLGWVSFLQD